MIRLRINGKVHEVDVGEDMPLLWALRDVIGLIGTKFGCGIAQCGACTVHLDGHPIRSCIMPVVVVGSRAGQPRSQIIDGLSVRDPPADVDDWAIPGHWEGDCWPTQSIRTSMPWWNGSRASPCW